MAYYFKVVDETITMEVQAMSKLYYISEYKRGCVGAKLAGPYDNKKEAEDYFDGMNKDDIALVVIQGTSFCDYSSRSVLKHRP